MHYWNSSLVQSLQVKLKLFVTRILPQLALDHHNFLVFVILYTPEPSSLPDCLEHGYVLPPANQHFSQRLIRRFAKIPLLQFGEGPY